MPCTLRSMHASVLVQHNDSISMTLLHARVFPQCLRQPSTRPLVLTRPALQRAQLTFAPLGALPTPHCLHVPSLPALPFVQLTHGAADVLLGFSCCPARHGMHARILALKKPGYAQGTHATCALSGDLAAGQAAQARPEDETLAPPHLWHPVRCALGSCPTKHGPHLGTTQRRCLVTTLLQCHSSIDAAVSIVL